jgi:hypothetical protein
MNAAGLLESLGEGRQSGALEAARPSRSAENSMAGSIEQCRRIRKDETDKDETDKITRDRMRRAPRRRCDACGPTRRKSWQFDRADAIFAVSSAFDPGAGG